MNDAQQASLAESAIAELQKSLPNEPGGEPGAEHRNRRIHDLYLPIYLWLSRAVAEKRARSETRDPLVVGISAPQGSGKSTLCNHLVALFAGRGMRAASVSIDDFYLRNGEQRALAASHPDNPYLKYRGYPGTHDTALGTETIDALRALNSDRKLPIATYDKSAFNGRGDRLPQSQWRVVQGPLDLVIVEGWILGFQPFDESRVQVDDESLREINRRLRAYDAWTSRIERMVIWSAAELEQIVQWRMDAEAKAVRAGKPALDTADIEDYIRRCIPAYWLYADTVAKGRWADGKQLLFRLDADRLPLIEGST